MAITCVTCETDQSPTWWKCCRTHTTEQGFDVVCKNCANECFDTKLINSPIPTVSVSNMIIISPKQIRLDEQLKGKTTTLVEKAIELLGDLPENAFVFITGAHSRWLFELESRFKDAGLTGIKFFTPSQIRNGALRGRNGVLLIDDQKDLKTEDWLFLTDEQIRLRRGLKIYL